MSQRSLSFRQKPSMCILVSLIQRMLPTVLTREQFKQSVCLRRNAVAFPMLGIFQSVTFFLLLIFVPVSYISADSTKASEEPRVLDTFNDTSGLIARNSDGVLAELSQEAGFIGKGVRVDFDFQQNAGWAAAIRPTELSIKENFAIEFKLRGKTPINQFEVKLIDETGENVWWAVFPKYDFPSDWKHFRLKRRHFSFAWGPNGDKPLEHISAIEFTVAAVEGGKGTIWIDELNLQMLPPDEPYDLQPEFSTSSSSGSLDAVGLLSGNKTSAWRSLPTDNEAWLQVDFLKLREFGGLILNWDEQDYATDYLVEQSDNAQEWKLLQAIKFSDGGNDYLSLPESEARYLRIRVQKTSQDHGVGLHRLEVAPIRFGDSLNNMFARVAQDAPAGEYPKYFLGIQSNWTVIGVDGDTKEALINEEGQIELEKATCSVEPFLIVDDQLFSWHDAVCNSSLLDNELPIPSVNWDSLPIELQITAFAEGPPEASTLYVRYTLTNSTTKSKNGKLLLTVRPFQVNPSWQFLNTQGGVAPIFDLRFDGSGVLINDKKTISTYPSPDSSYGVTFDEGGVMRAIRNGFSSGNIQHDSKGLASGVMEFSFELAAGESKTVNLLAPFHKLALEDNAADRNLETPQKLEKCVAEWRDKLDEFELNLPAEYQHISETLNSTLAYTLINRDGYGFQPGSRSYERSWIRDGSLTSAALLQLGQFETVRDYVRWYASYQFENGKVPCVVDRRGAEPVPENDSHGQLIYAIAEYHRYTKDNDLLVELWPHIQAAVGYIKKLRQERMTDEYLLEAKRAYFGLVPESISHEGYSAQPMHSYWDDWFTLKGLKDAVYIAEQLGEMEKATEYSLLRDSFQEDLLASLEIAMVMHEIDFLPGCVELGDFDATSTTVAVTPCGDLSILPSQALQRTFDKYWENFSQRRDGNMEWSNYTPYELRVVGTFVRLGQKKRAWEALSYFFKDRRPPAWNHWAEVVWKEPETPEFIGDMPHTWVGSDFIRSLLSMFVYFRESDETLVIGAGIPECWVNHPEGVSFRNLQTYFGGLNFDILTEKNKVVVSISGNLDIPPGGLEINSPLEKTLDSVMINGAPKDAFQKAFTLSELPVTVEFNYEID